MDDSDLLRYSRHILLPEVGVEGQTRINQARVLLVGAGGLGSAAALYLAASGVGHITLVDDDVVDLTNLQRQIAHTTQRVGQSKVTSAAQAMHDLNPSVQVQAVAQRADAEWLGQTLASIDLVLDCSDNFATRLEVNAACVQAAKPLVWAAAVQMDAQLGCFTPGHQGPCYACIFPPEAGASDANCSTMGVLSPLVGAIGSLQAALAIQWLAQDSLLAPNPMAGKILMVDLRRWDFDQIRVSAHPACPVCQGQAAQPH